MWRPSISQRSAITENRRRGAVMRRHRSTCSDRG
nr:MAG TPA: hypothetical protein [Bacteriophage sp.]